MSRYAFAFAVLLALAASPTLAQDFDRHVGPGAELGQDHDWDDDAPLARAPRRSENFGHGYDPYDDGREAWLAPEPYRGSWADHADAYYGYGQCGFVREPVLGQRGEIVDYRRVRVCD